MAQELMRFLEMTVTLFVCSFRYDGYNPAFLRVLMTSFLNISLSSFALFLGTISTKFVLMICFSSVGRVVASMLMV